jgi:NDP-sugar pyrophosphorylase family protein
MKAGIIAAGLGERLRARGITVPKPLVPIAGRALIDYVLDAAATAGVREIACIVNGESSGIEEHCRGRWPQLAFEFIRRTTPSSMESVFALRPLLENGRFLLLTVDAVFAPAMLGRFLTAAAAHPDAQGVLALSAFVDDEKPLWARTAADGRITGLGAEASGGPPHRDGLVTAGFYLFDPGIFREIPDARKFGFTAFRQFLGHLLQRGYCLYGEVIGKTIDVDRPEDIAVAEAFVRNDFAP